MTTIRTRLVVSFVAIVLVAALTTLAFMVVLTSRDARARVVAQLQSVAALKEAEIDSWAQQLRVALDLVVSGEEAAQDLSILRQTGSPEAAKVEAQDRMRDNFRSYARRMGLFGELFIMDTQGAVLVSTDPVREGERHSYYDYFLEGLKYTYLQEPSYALGTGTTTIVIASPVVAEGRVLGVVAGRATMQSLNTIMLERAGLGETGETYLVGSNRRLLTSVRDETIAEDPLYVTTTAVDEAVTRHKGGSGTYVGYDGDTVVGVYRWLPSLKVALLAEQQEGEALAATRSALITVGGVVVLAVALTLLAAVLLTRSIVRPLGQLAETATLIAGGDLERVARVERDDEVGRVADAFNQMTAQLRGSVRSLEQRSDQLRTINEVGRQISSIRHLDELLPYVAGTLQETFGYQEVCIHLMDGATGEPAASLTHCTHPGDLVREVARTGEIIWVDHLVSEPVGGPGGQSPAVGRGIARSEMAVPIKIQTDVVGVLDIRARELDAFQEVDRFTAVTLADQLAIAIVNSQLYDRAQELAAIHERQRLARDLHDAVSQTLFSTSLIAEVLPRLWEKDPDEARRRMEELRRLAKGALAEMRMLLLELRPAAVVDAGLPELLRHLVDAFGSRAGIPAVLVLDGDVRLPPDVHTAVYRVAQEALNNVQKHSQATTASVRCSAGPDRVELTVVDDGIGFDPANLQGDRLGIRIMRERADGIGGTVTFESAAGKGTSVRLVWVAAPGALIDEAVLTVSAAEA